MHLANLFLLATTAIGAIAQYDEAEYNSIQYDMDSAQYDGAEYDIDDAEFADPVVGYLSARVQKQSSRGLT
ncbi:hypothetical protein VCV18_004705 [Metarhizium anisopliae]